jgi:hypothetical protein
MQFVKCGLLLVLKNEVSDHKGGKYDYVYEERLVLAYVELFGLDLEVLEALNKKDYARIQRILSSI